jgi:hypothetical protein
MNIQSNPTHNSQKVEEAIQMSANRTLNQQHVVYSPQNIIQP